MMPRSPFNPIPAIAQGLTQLIAPGQVVEVRIPKVGGKKTNTAAGYFTDMTLLAREAARYDGKAAGIYFTPNAVKESLLARAANRIKEYASETTQDIQITRRYWLMIDCDPIRDAGISSTESEHQDAHTRAQVIQLWLAELGWPEPVYADSGNGAHLMYKIDLPNDEAATELVTRCLESLATRHNDSAVGIDTTVYNAARIWKLYGTLACKGDDTPERPWRRAGILHSPEHLEIVPTTLLEALAAHTPRSEPHATQTRHTRWERSELENVETWLNRHHVGVALHKVKNGADVYVLDECPFNPEHGQDSAVFQSASGALGFHCLHNGCADKHWQDFRVLHEPDAYTAKDAPPPPESAPQSKPAEPVREVEIWEDPLPLAVADRPPFPLFMLPEGLYEYVKAEAEETQTVVDSSAMMVLAVCSACIAGRVQVHVKGAWNEPVNLWALVVQESGEGKSIITDHTADPMRRYEALEAANRKSIVVLAQSEARIAEMQLSSAEKTLAAAPEGTEEYTAAKTEREAAMARKAENEAVYEPQYLAGDATPEALAELMHQNGDRIAAFPDEGGMIFSLMNGRYGDKPNYDIYLSSYSGKPYVINRKGRGAIRLDTPLLTMGLTVQEIVLKECAQDKAIRERGMLARFLYSVPLPRDANRDILAPAMPPAVRTRYAELITHLLALTPATDEEGKRVPHTLVLSETAMARFATWHNTELEPRRRPRGDLADMRDWANKLHGTVLRLAGVLHMVKASEQQTDWHTPISLETMKEAIEIATYLIPHARIALGLLRYDPDVQNALTAWQWIRDNKLGSFTKRALHRAKFIRERAEAVQAALDYLSERGYIRLLPREKREGKPGAAYETNTDLFKCV